MTTKPKVKWLYQATVKQVKDGDTLCLDIELTSLPALREELPTGELVDLGFSVFLSPELLPLVLAGSRIWRKEESIRLLGLNAPEKDTVAGKDVLAFVQGLLPVDKAITLETFRVKSRTKQEKYGRFLGRIILPDGRCLNDILLELGFAVPMKG